MKSMSKHIIVFLVCSLFSINIWGYGKSINQIPFIERNNPENNTAEYITLNKNPNITISESGEIIYTLINDQTRVKNCFIEKNFPKF